MIKRAKISLTCLLCLALTAGYSQQAVTASGKDFSGLGGSISWSVGQVAYTTSTGVSGSVSQGVEQALRTSAIGIPNPGPLTTTLSVFPNPATDNFILQIPGYKFEKMSYQLFDIQGRLLESKSINGIQTTIYTNTLPPSSYFLNILQGEKQLRSFTIIKK